MKFFILFLLMALLAGCDRGRVSESSVENDPASPGEVSGSPIAKTDTLKVTYSKADPFEQKKSVSKDGPQKASPDGHASHGEKSTLAPDKKNEHKEHEHK